MVANARLAKAGLIVADEPTSRLDPILQRETMLLRRKLVAERGLSLLLVSHHAALVDAVADSVTALGRATVTLPVARQRGRHRLTRGSDDVAPRDHRSGDHGG